ncbi:BglG family transcription antiterminator [Enterococcus gallinarum]|uniref:BglG family transcription antiterminator n=3 Tax=Enterococcus gallinarum TaxID=1353 RepID=UPI001D94FB95|nr:PTS sugar transporter subunit IIA [Enterococcus gallinarum]MDT2681198.1 PTS sugar transporter subunit IIA [Enterococcus gallinarum]HJE79915.1 PTS sugar transporter subunit IIA [Enterococcus gallinarum]
MIDYRLSYLIGDSKEKYLLDQATEMTKMRKIDLLFAIKKINEMASDLFETEILITETEIEIPKTITRSWIDLFFNQKREEVVFLEEERQAMIFLLTFAQFEELSVYYFQDFLSVSKNTILKDLKKLRAALVERGVTLEYSRKNGFFLNGAEASIRGAAFYLLGILAASPNGNRLLYEGLSLKSPNLYTDVRLNFSMTIEEFDLVFVPTRFEEMVYFISYLICRTENYEIDFLQEDQALLAPLIAHKASNQFLAHFSKIKNRSIESYYFTVIFMTVLQGEIQDTSLEFLLECSSEIIHEIERLSAIEFKNYRKLLLDLFYHLVPAYFRIKFDFKLSNVLIDEIKMQYHEIFELTKLVLFPLRKLVQKDIPDEEIGYFTILFGGEISNQRQKKRNAQLRALILCPSGISSSLIMKSELQELFPQIDFSETSSFEQFHHQGMDSAFDIIFSSVPVKTDKKLYVINPIMTQLEKNALMRRVQEDFLFPKVLIPSVNEILDILIPHIELKNGITKEKLYNIVQKKMNKEMKRREDDRPMLSELLTADMIQLTDRKMGWEEAINTAADPLKKKEKINQTYIEVMINKVKDYGPFIHIGKGVALPHARPQDGVNELGMSLLKVDTPVLLSDDEKHPIQIFICLAAIDNEMHLKALASLTRILSNKEKLDTLLNASTKEEILEIMTEGEDE